MRPSSLQTGEHSVAGGAERREHDMARLLATEAVPARAQFLQDVAVADGGGARC